MWVRLLFILGVKVIGNQPWGDANAEQAVCSEHEHEINVQHTLRSTVLHGVLGDVVHGFAERCAERHFVMENGE